MKWASIGLAALALIAGLIAAAYWYRSTKVPSSLYAGVESGEEITAIEDQQWGMILSAQCVADLNKIAAYWTAATAVLSALSAVFGALASN